MSEQAHIIGVELENVKRVQLVKLAPSASGLTVIGGDNAQGKTSVLDGIAYALGGEKFRPSQLQREGGQADARVEVRLSNGLVARRDGKNASLKVSDPTGAKGGQKLLDAFVEELSLDLPKFLAMTSAKKGEVLLKIIGIGDQLAEIEKAEKACYDQRHALGIVADQKEKYALEMPEHHGIGDELQLASDLLLEAQAIGKRNQERAGEREKQRNYQAILDTCKLAYTAAEKRVQEIEAMLTEAKGQLAARGESVWKAEDAIKKAQPVDPDESTDEVQKRIDELEIHNSKVRENQNKLRAADEAEEYRRKYDNKSTELEQIRASKKALLDGVEMPLVGLSVVDGELVYMGKSWDCMSGMEQIRVGIAIVRKLKPSCGFVLLDGLEAFDLKQLEELNHWLQHEGLQAIATRVSKGDECSIIIEDGMVAVSNATETQEENW